MNTKILIAGVAMAALAAGAASAHTHKHRMAGASTYAAPAQPIPYSQLDAYLHASPGERQQMAQGGGMSGGMNSGAPTGSPADTSAAAPSNDMASPPAPASGDTGSMNSGPMNNGAMNNGAMNNGSGAVNPPSSPMPGQPNGAASPSQPGAMPMPQDGTTPPK